MYKEISSASVLPPQAGIGHPTMIRRKFFTIIELLMVVAIITILASILLPALNAAREKAKSVACNNRLSQCAKGVMGYSVDYEDWVLPMRAGGKWWIAHLESYLNTPTSNKGDILVCPGNPDETHTSAYNTNYGYNTRCGDGNSTPGSALWFVKFTRVRHPTRGLLITDEKNRTGGNAYKWDINLFSKPLIDRRHSGGANLLFLDGHIGWGGNIVDNTPLTNYWARWADDSGH